MLLRRHSDGPRDGARGRAAPRIRRLPYGPARLVE